MCVCLGGCVRQGLLPAIVYACDAAGIKRARVLPGAHVEWCNGGQLVFGVSRINVSFIKLHMHIFLAEKDVLNALVLHSL